MSKAPHSNPAALLAALLLAAACGTAPGDAVPRAATPHGAAPADTTPPRAGLPGDATPPHAEPRVIQGGAPGAAPRATTPADHTAATRPRHTAADVRFMQDMIVHHVQALVMAELVPARTARAEIRLLARRIEAAQDDEIAQMRQWLERRGATSPVVARQPGHAHHDQHEHGHMPGMLTAAQLDQLAAARGDEFDVLFLELMIQHHEGALVMVAALFDSEGAGQEAEIFDFASHVDATQRMEIGRMRDLRRTILQRGTG